MTFSRFRDITAALVMLGFLLLDLKFAANEFALGYVLLAGIIALPFMRKMVGIILGTHTRDSRLI